MKILFAVFFLLLASNSALSCSCVAPDKNQETELIKSVSVIFTGKVISISYPVREQRKDECGRSWEYIPKINYEFEVERIWQGVETETVIIETLNESCNPNFVIGRSYEILAYPNPYTADKAPAFTEYCTLKSANSYKFIEIYGEGKTFENAQTQRLETANNFWAYLWNKIVSFFS